MAFLFKSKKQQQERGLASRDGVPGSSGSLQGRAARDEKIALQRATPTGSLNSLQDDGSAGSPDQGFGRRGPSVDQTQPQQQSDLPFRNGPQVGNPNAALYPWSQRRLTYTSSHPSPFPRYGAAINSVSSKEGDIYIMGGLINSSTVKGDLWMIEAGGNMACYPLATTAEGPGPRVGHASLLVGNAFIVYGGDTKIDESDVLDETLYLLNTSTRQWSRALPAGPRPSGRYGHSLNILGSKIFIFGGQVEGYFMNDLCAFDLNQLQVANNRWEMLIPNTEVAGSQVPSARTNHSMVTFNDKLFLFGGTNGYQWFNDVWCYDPTTNKWSQLDCIGYIPVPREGHAASIVDDVMYIFGGRTEDGTDLGDLAAFRITSRRWYTFQNMGPSPSARSGHRMTTVGKQVIVLGGEPSSSASSSNDLAIAYVLDTSKIRYPNDSQPATSQRVQGRRPSASDSQGTPTSGRQLSSRDGSTGPPETKRLIGSASAPPVSMNGFRSPPNGPESGPAPAPAPFPANGSQIGRATGASPPVGPPPQGPTPAKPTVNASNIPRVRGPSVERDAAANVVVSNQSPVTREPAKDESPITNGRRTPTQQVPKSAPKPEFAVAETPAKGKQQRQRSQGSIDSTNDTAFKAPAARPASPPPPTRQTSNPLSRRSSGRNSQTVALLKELDASRNRNAWYASELELARKAGYVSNSSLSPVLDSRATETFDDEDKPLIEALIAMKNELANVQASVDKQAIVAAKQIAEAEKQRDVAIQEAVYAKAKLAAHAGGSAASTPQLDNDRDADGTDRANEMSRKLASALGYQRDLQAQMENMKSALEAERRARQLADDTSSASQRRMTELETYKQSTSAEMSQLKSALHKAQRELREQSMSATEAVAAMNLLRADKEELTNKYNESVGNDKERGQTLDSLRQALAAATETSSHLERRLEDEKSSREKLETKFNKLKAEHEARMAELVAAMQRLRDAEALAEKHAQEARTHRQAVLTGLDKISVKDGTPASKGDAERIMTLQSQIASTTALAKKYQQEADTTAEQLRAAEERIAGLELYQEQASRDGVSIRKQLQMALKETQTLQAQTSDLKRELSAQHLETNAMTVQNNALKDILGERGISPTSAAAKARGLNSPRAGSPGQQARVRELEQQLASVEQSRQTMAAQLQGSESQYRDKLAQLESDYNSAIAYLKSTEKMLKKLKDEHAIYKAENKKLKTEMEDLEEKAAKASSAAAAPSDWEKERGSLQRKIETLQSELRATSNQMEKRLATIRTEADSAKRERDAAVKTADEATRRITTNKRDLDQLQQENILLEQRAQDAEQKVALLLDQVETSVDNYRRRSRQVTGINPSELVATNGGHAAHARNDSSEVESVYGSSGIDGRNSAALDNLANELETLRTHWEANNKNYRLSNAFDFETSIGARKEDDPNGLGLSESLADWRKRLDVEEKGPHPDTKSKARPA